MTETSLATALLSEILSAEQALKSTLMQNLPKGMELSHFSVLNQLARGGERTPAQLARTMQVTKGAMTNTLKRLEAAGHIHIRPDWDDARRKLVAISPAGLQARDIAIAQMEPVLNAIVDDLGPDRIRQVLPVLRAFRDLMRE